MSWKIYHKDGSVLTDVNDKQITVHGLEYSDKWMEECFVTIDFKHESPIKFAIGDYLIYRNGERFELNYDPGKQKQARVNTYGEGFVYEGVKFNSLQDELARTEFLDVVLNDNQLHYTSMPKFQFYVETIDDLLDRIQANLDEQIGNGMWKIFSRSLKRSLQRGVTEEEWKAVYGDEETDTGDFDSQSITVDSQTCWEALALANSKWDINFVVRNRNVYVGTAGKLTNGIFKYGLGKGLYEIEQNADSDQSIITRLRAYGSEKNLPSHYYADLGIKYKANITKVENASTYVEFDLDLEYIDTYFKNPRKFSNGVSSEETTNGWVLKVTFDYKTIITGYVTKNSDGKCRFYSELKNNQYDNGDEESKDSLDAFIDQVKSGETLLYISNGINSKTIPYENKEYAKNLPNNMSISRLMLPGFPHLSLKEFWDSLSDEEKKYVNPSGREHVFSTDKYRPYIDSVNLEKIGLRSGSQFFDTDDKTNGVIEIYPTIEEMEIGGVRIDEIYKGSEIDDNGRFDDGETVKNFDIYLNPAIDFDINDLRDDDFSISMKDGMCGGRSFKVASATKIEGMWRLSLERVKDDALDLYFPYKDYPIKNGDHFVLTGIELPESYIKAAALKLLKYAIALLDKNDYTRYVYQPKVDEIFMARQHDEAMADKTGAIVSYHDTLKAGDIMQFEDEDLGIDAQITIDQLTIKEEDGKIPTYEITLREDKEVGTIEKIQQQISSLSSGNGGSGGGATMSQVKSVVASEGGKYFLSKLNNDTAQGLITFLKGLKVGNTGNYEITADGLARLFAFMTVNFNSGLYGQGASIDNKGAAELDSLFVRKFISTPKFVFNEISVTKAEQWNTNGYGTIESVDTTKRQITLKLEENDYGSLSEGDICRGIYADIDNSYGSDSIEEGALDDCNFVTHKGFFTTYFYVRRIITAEKGKFVFEYGKRNRNTPDPCAFMDFAQYGSFTDSDRMSSMYFCSRGRSYIEVLDGVKTWEVQVENRVARYGYLGNLRVKRKDGTYIDLKGNGLFAQNNVYFGDNIFRLENISNLDELENLAASYDVTLSQYQSVLTIDDMGNVINGLYTEDEGKITKQYRVSTAVFVRKGNNILLEEDENNEDVTEGHYRLHVVSAECTCEVQNSTVFITGINNIKDGVLGSDDDDNFDYDAMRKMTDCMVTIVVDLEGKTSKVVQMPIRIQHDSLPFMVCDLTNEHASVSWHTKHKHYAGLPIETTVNMFYKNEPYEFGMRASLPKEVSDYLDVSVADSGKSKVLTIDKKADFSSDVLPTSFEVGIYCVSDYAGAKYEYTKKLSVSKTADAVIYEIVPSANSVSVNSKNEVSPSSVGCEVWATSSDDKRYQVTALPDGYSLYYQKDGGTLNAMQLGAKITVAATDKEIAFVLKHTENGVSYVDDKEGVPVVKDGKGGMMALCSDNMVSVSVDVNGKVAAALNSSLSFRLFAGEKELTVSGISINASPTSKVVTATVSGNTLNLSCAVGADFGKYDMSYIIKVDGKDGSVSYSSYVAVKVVPNVLGKGMVSVNTWYALGDSATDKPSDSEFTYDTMGAAVIASNADKYLWSGDKITYSDRSTAFTGIYLVGKCSELASVTEQYAKTTTAIEPTDGWSDVYPSSVAKGDFIWSRDKITWKNGSVSYSAAQLAGYIGVDGKGYEYVYYLASENKTPAKPSRRAEATLTGGWTDSIPSMDSNHGYIFVSCRQGEPFAESSQDEWSTPVLYARLPKQIDSVNTWYGLSSSITTLPSSYSYDKMSDAVIKDNADKYLWSADKVTYTDGTSEFTGTYCVGKCSELASIKEQYGTSTSSTTKPTSWSDSYPSNLTKGTYIWTRDYITWKNGGTEQTDAQLAGYIGTDGAGQVVAYKRATSMPNYTPSVTDYDTYKGTDDLGSGWTKSAPSSDDSLVSGGSVSSVSANNYTNGGTWSSVADGGYNWYKSPSVADNGIATMRIYFTTSVANQYVTFYLRAYSENNYDFVLISGVDSTSLTRDSGYTARVSGNGNDTYIRLKCSTAGQHFVTVAYAKDVSGSNNGDYGLVRMATSENYISQSSILYRCDGSVTDNVISWGSIYQAQGDKGDNGDKGDQGVGISSVTTYYLISSLSSGVSTSTSGWTTSMVNPSSSKPYLWSYTMTTLTDGSEVNSTPVIIGNFAEAGPMGTNGCIVRNSIWKSGVEYRNDSALTTDGVKYLDYVYVENSNANDGWDKYVCNTTHTSTSYNGPTSSYGYWTKLSDAGPIYSPLIVAKNAAINFAQGQQFNLVSSNSIFGSFRIPGSDGYALWLGGSSASDAPFKVNKDGKMVASDAEITGKITADSGSIGGVTITQSWLGSGVIELGNEYYTGAILSNKGLFTGYKNCYFGAGGFADTNPKGEFNKMYEMDGTSNVNGNMSAPAAYIRKYTPENSILNNIDKPYGAALIVDVPRGVGITSYGANIFGSLALGALASSSSIGSTNTFFQRNRASVAVLTSGGDFYLPSNPQQGQIVIVIHAGGIKVTFYHPGKSLVTYQGVKSSGSFYSSTKGQFNFFVYIDSMWYGTYCNG